MKFFNSFAGEAIAESPTQTEGYTNNFNPEGLQKIVSEVFAKELTFESAIEAADFISKITVEAIKYLEKMNLAVNKTNVETHAEAILEQAESQVAGLADSACPDPEIVEIVEEVPCTCQKELAKTEAEPKIGEPKTVYKTEKTAEITEWTAEKVRTRAKIDFVLLLIIGVFIALLLYFRNVAVLLIGAIGIFLINRKLTENERRTE